MTKYDRPLHVAIVPLKHIYKTPLVQKSSVRVN